MLPPGFLCTLIIEGMVIRAKLFYSARDIPRVIPENNLFKDRKFDFFS